jgi:hypothetical protein
MKKIEENLDLMAYMQKKLEVYNVIKGRHLGTTESRTLYYKKLFHPLKVKLSKINNRDELI